MNIMKLLNTLLLYWLFKKPTKLARKIGVKLGKDCEILDNPYKVFGSEPWLVSLGDKVRITNGVRFITHDGSLWVLRNLDSNYSNLDLFAPIKIGNNVFIGLNSIILPGVSIGDNVIIGANSVVTKDVCSNTVVGGSPARIIENTSEYLNKIRSKEMYETKKMNIAKKKNFVQSKHPEWFD